MHSHARACVIECRITDLTIFRGRTDFLDISGQAPAQNARDQIYAFSCDEDRFVLRWESLPGESTVFMLFVIYDSRLC